jgi:hypothetical protein
MNMSSSVVIVPPVMYVPAYGGTFSNGIIKGYGSIRDNINKKIQTGYFNNGVLTDSPIISTYIEWTTAPEQVLMVLGNFSDGKANGIMYKYQSTGSIYCTIGDNKSNKIARSRYMLADKTKQECKNGDVISSTSMGTVTIAMNWVNNNLLNVFDLGNVSLDVGYEVDNAVRADSIKLVSSNKSSFTNSIYN